MKPEKIYVLKNEHLKQLISEELADLLQNYTIKNDRSQVSIDTGVGIYTIDKLIQRAHPLTKNSSKAIVALVQIAINRCDEAVENALVAKVKLAGSIELIDNPEKQ